MYTNEPCDLTGYWTKVYQLFTGCRPIYCVVHAAISVTIFHSILECHCQHAEWGSFANFGPWQRPLELWKKRARFVMFKSNTYNLVKKMWHRSSTSWDNWSPIKKSKVYSPPGTFAGWAKNYTFRIWKCTWKSTEPPCMCCHWILPVQFIISNGSTMALYWIGLPHQFYQPILAYYLHSPFLETCVFIFNLASSSFHLFSEVVKYQFALHPTCPHFVWRP